MLYLTRHREILFALVLCFFPSSFTPAQSNDTNRPVAARSSAPVRTLDSGANAISSSGGKRPGGFAPVVIYYQTPPETANPKTKAAGSKNSAAELRATAGVPTKLGSPYVNDPTKSAVMRSALSFQPVTIRYRVYGRAIASRPPAANTGTRIDSTEAGTLSSKVKTQNPEPAWVNAGVATAPPAVASDAPAGTRQIEAKPASPARSDSAPDQPIPVENLVEKKEASAANDSQAMAAGAAITTGEHVADQPRPDTLTTQRTAQGVAAAADNSAQPAPVHEENENTVEKTRSDLKPPDIPLPAAGVSAPPLTGPTEQIAQPASDPISLNNAAVRLMRESNFEEAMQALQRAIAGAPTESKFHRNLSVLYERLNRMDEAIAAAQRSVELAPREALGYVQLCGLKVIKGQNAEAIACYDRLLNLGELDIDSQTYYGIALLRSGENGKAAMVLEKAAASVPTNVPIRNALGIVYFNLKQYAEAAQSFKQAVELDPKHGELRFNLALAQTANRNKEGGISQYRILKQEHPKLADELYALLFQNNVVHVDALKK